MSNTTEDKRDIKQYLLHIGMSDKSINDMSLKPGDHEFFVKIHDDWERTIKSDLSVMFSGIMADHLKVINNTYDKHAEVICSIVREMLVEQSKETKKMIGEAITQQNIEIFKKIDDQNEIISQITTIQLQHSQAIADHEKRLRILEKKLADLLIEHNSHHNRYSINP